MTRTGSEGVVSRGAVPEAKVPRCRIEYFSGYLHAFGNPWTSASALRLIFSIIADMSLRSFVFMA